MIHKITLSGYSATTDDISGVLILGTYDSYGIERIQLELGPEWNALVIKATFNPPTGSEPVTVVADTSGQLRVPQEATSSAGQGAITFVGTAAGLQRISTDLPYIVKTHSQIEGATPSPTPSEWEQFVAQVQQARDDAAAAAQAAEDSQTAAADRASNAAESAEKTAQSAQKAQNIVDGAVQYITAAKNAAVQEVNTVGNIAVQKVQQAQSTGVQAVQEAQNTAMQAVQTAQTAGVNAVNDAAADKVDEIEQINSLLPKPTEADAGKVPVAQPDGSYQLGDAGNKIDDTVIAENTTWSSKETASRIYQMREVSGAIVRIDDALPEFPMKVNSESEVTRCGKNLLDISGMRTTQNKGLTFELKDGGMHITGTATSVADSPVFYLALPTGTYVGNITGKNYPFVNASSYVVKKADGSRLYKNAQSAFTVEPDEVGLYFYLALNENVKIDATLYPQLEVGAEATNYEPYTGETFPAGEPIMPIDGVNTIFAASGGVTVGYASKVKAPINDAQITPLNTWSAQKLVDTLCPPFSVTGDAVQFNPVEGYPLSVQSTIVATQEGTGDPSPTNVRPIVPVNEVSVWVCGKNVLSVNDLSYEENITVAVNTIAPGAYVFSGEFSNDSEVYNNVVVFFKNGNNVVKIAHINNKGAFSTAVEFISPVNSVNFYATNSASTNPGVSATLKNMQLELGTSATAYEPYRGQLYTAQLSEPCYGGTVDLTGGTGEAAYQEAEFSGNWAKVKERENVWYINFVHKDVPADVSKTPICAFAKSFIVANSAYGSIESGEQSCAIFNANGSYLQLAASTALKDQYTPAQLSALGKILYPLKTPTPFTFTPCTISAPASPATAYSTAGQITVEGRSDPIEYINQQIANAIAIAKV